jgi:hypothetical protein
METALQHGRSFGETQTVQVIFWELEVERMKFEARSQKGRMTEVVRGFVKTNAPADFAE